MKHKLLSIIFLISIAIGCSIKVDHKMLIGKYSFINASRDSIFIYENEYMHKFSALDGRVFKSTGQWKYDSTLHEILFKDFVFFNDQGSDGLPPGNWYSKVQVTDEGEVRLMYSSEDNIYYSKKK